MERDAYGELLGWKESSRRKPLIVGGIRQCGKTYLIKEFAEKEYPSYAYFSFENNPALSSVFEKNPDPHRIVRELSVMSSSRITPETLLIFDEIQFCPAALSSLKYFCEDAPEYHVVCAGSLLGIRISQLKKKKNPSFSFPVGKVSYLDMYPMNFHEYVRASNAELADYLKDLKPFEPVSEALLPSLDSLFREYCAVGGMPEAVDAWLNSGDMRSAEKIQDEILRGYESDFSKYAPAGDIPKISAIWSSLPSQLSKENRKFMFGHAVAGSRASQLEDALQWLIDAGLVYRIPLTEKPEIPLSESEDNRIFKIYACDVGLLRRMAGLEAKEVMDPAADRMKGAIAENFVLCELIPQAGGKDRVFYWKNPKGDAEIDFLFRCGSNIVPVEVKSGKVPRLGSLETYISKYSPEVSALVSQKNVRGGKVRFIPFCLAWKLAVYCGQE